MTTRWPVRININILSCLFYFVLQQIDSPRRSSASRRPLIRNRYAHLVQGSPQPPQDPEIHALQRELRDVRRQLHADIAQERAIVENLHELGAEDLSDASEVDFGKPCSHCTDSSCAYVYTLRPHLLIFLPFFFRGAYSDEGADRAVRGRTPGGAGTATAARRDCGRYPQGVQGAICGPFASRCLY